MYTGKFFVFCVLLLIICNSTYCIAKLSLFDQSRNELASFETIDFMWIKPSLISLSNASLVISEFLNDSTPCRIKRPSRPDIDVLLIRFDEVSTNYGCSSYADVIQSNGWLDNQDDTSTSIPETAEFPSSESVTITTTLTGCELSSTPKSTTTICNKALSLNMVQPRDSISPPRIIIFTSMNGGDPGIREKFYGDFEILSKAKSNLALIRISDATKVSKLKPKTSFVEFISDKGPWMELFESKELKIWCILFGIFYSSIIISSFSLFVLAIKKYHCALTNPRLWLFIAIIICACIFLSMLEYDPWAMRSNHLSELMYESIVTTGYYVLCLSYAIFLFPWIKATKNLSEEVIYKIEFVQKICRIFKVGIIIAILLKTVSIMFYLLQFSSMKIKISSTILQLIFIILEGLFCLIAMLIFGIFGTIIFFARMHEQHLIRALRKRRRPNQMQPSARQSLACVNNIINNLDFIYHFAKDYILLVALHSNTIGKYSHMTYTGSSDENVTISTISSPPSRGSSFHNSSIAAGATSRHQRRTTVEILFGRRSLGL
ncbi:12893_t:CDS:2 [Funneliformis geosporum]|uniref:18704_t:CDS:1 n=1 Tax=Funneliformis geosporum TaxID=1117311 RepID=A0A9W4SLF5_9GLOM|nr:12893_t:CDS:2 [Funneliformis geosporum]CAI2173757.1 18704_t:CDS:2 [Funneliformis geosporum]